MTGSQTDAVSVPRYAQAVKILLSLAHLVFEKVLTESGNEAQEHWYVLRSVAERIVRERRLQISDGQMVPVVAALLFAHDVEHDYELTPAPLPADCKCRVAEWCEDFARLLEAEQRETEAA